VELAKPIVSREQGILCVVGAVVDHKPRRRRQDHRDCSYGAANIFRSKIPFEVQESEQRKIRELVVFSEKRSPDI